MSRMDPNNMSLDDMVNSSFFLDDWLEEDDDENNEEQFLNDYLEIDDLDDITANVAGSLSMDED